MNISNLQTYLYEPIFICKCACMCVFVCVCVCLCVLYEYIGANNMDVFTRTYIHAHLCVHVCLCT